MIGGGALVVTGGGFVGGGGGVTGGGVGGGAGVPVPVESNIMSLHPGRSSGEQTRQDLVSRQSFWCLVVKEHPLSTVPF